MVHRNRQAFALVLVGVAALALAGCASGGNKASQPTKTVTQTVQPSDGTSTSTSSAPTSPSGSATTPSGDTGGSVSGSLCTVAHLKGGTAAGSGGAAGSNIIHLTFTNTGSTTCVLQGWPGVSFVGDGNGTQIGQAATFDRASAHPTVTLKPGAIAVAPLKITQAANYSNADCSPVAADGFRVYPPGSKASLYIKAAGYTACKSTSVGILNVQGIVANGAAAD
jgi:hypothetical protein